MKNFSNTTPIYLQVREELESAIITGNIPADEMVPSIREIAKEYRLNPQTVSNAVSKLLADGYLYKKRGVGLFVSKDARRILMDRKINDFRRSEMPEVIKKGRDLGIEKDEFITVVSTIYEEEGNENEE